MALSAASACTATRWSPASADGRSLKSSLHKLFEQAQRDKLEPVTFLDLDWDVVNRELERERATRRSGPIAENILRDIGVGRPQHRVRTRP